MLLLAYSYVSNDTNEYKYFSAGAGSPAYQLQPCTVLKQQHGKAVALVKLTPTDIMTAGTDGRICRYHWRPASTHPDTDSHQTENTHLSLTPEHTLPAADHGSTATNSCDSPSAAVDSRGGSEGNKIHSQGQSNGRSEVQSKGQNNGKGNGQARDEERGGSSGQGMRLVCVAEERLPNITTVQDIVEIAGSKEQLVCGFQVLLLLLLMLILLMNGFCHHKTLVDWVQVIARSSLVATNG